ncbi:MAG: hypothetical protein H0W08_11175 [Acidobacteria bacterium]|nr:hypothetical protein [Acidobacteriota bacterium]
MFNLYRTNIAGDLGDLFIVYEGGDGAAQPLKVSARSATNGLVEIRTLDVVVKPIQNVGVLTPEQAAETIAAITSTESVLVEAGVKDAAQAKVSGEAKAMIILAKVPETHLQRNDQGLTELRIPKKDMQGFALDPRTLATEAIQKMTLPKGPGGGG